MARIGYLTQCVEGYNLSDNCVKCTAKEGGLPCCAPLAVGYVPVQNKEPERYQRGKALIRGTVFPGLDLPLGNVVNNKEFDCPLGKLMAVDFAAHDLSLYLDTHPEDTEAFAVYKELLTLSEKESMAYSEANGPLCKADLRNSNTYSWLKDPWPWEASANPEV